MDIQTKTRQGAMVCELSGKFDIEQTEKFENAFMDLIQSKPGHVGLDLGNVSYIDSSAISAIIKSLNLVKNYGGEMSLFNMKPAILEVFKMSRLDNFFKIMSAEEFNLKFPE